MAWSVPPWSVLGELEPRGQLALRNGDARGYIER